MGGKQVDEELVRQVKKGNKKAFDVLMLKYQSRITKVVSRYIKDTSEVMDVVQEAFIKAYRALPDFRGSSTFYTWMYRIAINTAKNHILYLKRQPSGIDMHLEAAEQDTCLDKLKEDATPEGFLVRDEVEVALFQALNNLPYELKNTIILRELVGMSYADIALAMKCPIGTVRSRIFRAREMLDAILGAKK